MAAVAKCQGFTRMPKKIHRSLNEYRSDKVTNLTWKRPLETLTPIVVDIKRWLLPMESPRRCRIVPVSLLPLQVLPYSTRRVGRIMMMRLHGSFAAANEDRVDVDERSSSPSRHDSTMTRRNGSHCSQQQDPSTLMEGRDDCCGWDEQDCSWNESLRSLQGSQRTLVAYNPFLDDTLMTTMTPSAPRKRIMTLSRSSSDATTCESYVPSCSSAGMDTDSLLLEPMRHAKRQRT